MVWWSWFRYFYKFHHGKGPKANCSHIEAVRIFKKGLEEKSWKNYHDDTFHASYIVAIMKSIVDDKDISD